MSTAIPQAHQGFNNGKELFDNQLQPGQILWNEFRPFASSMRISNDLFDDYHVSSTGTFVIPVDPDNLINGITITSTRQFVDQNANAWYTLDKYYSSTQNTHTTNIPKANLKIGTLTPVFTEFKLSEFSIARVLNKLTFRMTSATTFEFLVNGSSKSTMIATDNDDNTDYYLSIDKIEAY